MQDRGTDLPHHLLIGITQHAFGGGIERLDDSVRRGGNNGIIDALENGLLESVRLVQGFFGLAAHNELPDLVADGAEGLEQGFIGLFDVLAEELHHTP